MTVYTACYRIYVPALILFSLVAGKAPAAPTVTGIVEETGLRYWEWNRDGIHFRLTQRLPDQTRAFFLARGFDNDQVELIATQCVFQSKFQNSLKDSATLVSIDQNRWRVLHGSSEQPLLTREYWKEKWESVNIKPPARIAFEWALLPTQQTYAAGDYNWGMTSYGLPPGTRFSLVFSWQRDGEHHEGRLDDIECPPDIHPDPE